MTLPKVVGILHRLVSTTTPPRVVVVSKRIGGITNNVKPLGHSQLFQLPRELGAHKRSGIMLGATEIAKNRERTAIPTHITTRFFDFWIIGLRHFMQPINVDYRF
jgi:hypothetical protein